MQVAVEAFWLGGWGADTVAPTVSFVSQTRVKISRVEGGGVDSTDVTFTADEALQAWKCKVVTSESATHTQGTLLEAGGAVTGGQQVVFNVTDDELVAAGGVEGSNLLKIFGQDLAGNWST